MCRNIFVRTYVITVRFKGLMDNDWQFSNKIIEAKDVKEAINKTYESFKDNLKVIIDNIYSEQK